MKNVSPFNKKTKKTAGKLKSKKWYSKPQFIAFVILFAGVGSYFIYKSFAATEERWLLHSTYQENYAFYNRQGTGTYSGSTNCRDVMSICHNNGSSVTDTLASDGLAWESDPKQNGAGPTGAGNFTWFGPYTSGDWGHAFESKHTQFEGSHVFISPAYRACFWVRDMVSGATNSKVYIDINSIYKDKNYNFGKSNITLDGSSKLKYQPICLGGSFAEYDVLGDATRTIRYTGIKPDIDTVDGRSSDNVYTHHIRDKNDPTLSTVQHLATEFRLKVVSGRVRIDRVTIEQVYYSNVVVPNGNWNADKPEL